MFSFEKSGLWQASFCNPEFATEHEALSSLRESLINMRGRAEHLVSLIPRDIPGLTVHDVTHLDALWETASLIAGPNYALNPAEAFVFGGAVLLHDSAMSLAAYPGGLSDVEKTAEWRDAVASRLIAETGQPIERTQLDTPPDHIAKAALGDVLRETHAHRAAELPLIKWVGPDGDSEFLIQDSDLRTTYGDIIGKVAASHWWPVSDLRSLQKRVNAGGKVPASWTINPLKIACLLRVADAAHIDHRRAPRFLRTLVKPGPISDAHWAFQMKLGKPSIDKNFLVYTGSPFDVTEAEAWWLGYDMLASIDDELRAVHGALDNHQVPPFLATAVKAAKSPLAIAELIPTKKWTPVNTELRVSDVPSLVELLGGQRLYGSDLSIPIREILQNAADSIQARRLMTDPKSGGRVKVSLYRTPSVDILDIEDDGIGMSSRVLTGALLDFGRSFWKSGALRQEFPGLLSKGLKTTGRFGIGFFSVFMLGDHVTVTSRRFDEAVSGTHTLDFQKGLRMRPILRQPNTTEVLQQSGTRVRVALRIRYDEPEGLLFRGTSAGRKVLAPLREIISRISPAVDVDVAVEEEGKHEVAILANDWLTEDPGNLVSRAGQINSSSEHDLKSVLPNLRFLKDAKTGEIHGRACISVASRFHSRGVVTVGGFRASELQYLAGVLRGETTTVVRDRATPTAPGKVLRDWATEQASLISASNVSGKYKLAAAAIVMLFGGDASSLPIAIRDHEYLTAEELVKVLADLQEVELYQGDEIEYDEDDDVGPRSFESDFQVSSTLFLVPKRQSSILTIGKEQWPESVSEMYLPEFPKSCEEAFNAALARSWNCDAADRRDEDSRVVGELHERPIHRRISFYTRPADLSEYE